jgi:hypothetical protein
MNTEFTTNKKSGTNIRRRIHPTLHSWTLSSGTLMDSTLTPLNLHQKKKALCRHFMSVGNTLILYKVLSWQIMFFVGKNTLLVIGQTVELWRWFWTISSFVGLFSEMPIANTVPRASHFYSGVWSMNQLQDVKQMVHSWKSSCCPTYKVVMVTEVRTGCTFLTNMAPSTQELLPPPQNILNTSQKSYFTIKK